MLCGCFSLDNTAFVISGAVSGERLLTELFIQLSFHLHVIFNAAQKTEEKLTFLIMLKHF